MFILLIPTPLVSVLFCSSIPFYIYRRPRGLVCQIIEPVTFARCAFIIALRNIALDGYFDTRRNILEHLRHDVRPETHNIIYILVGCKHRASEGVFYIGGRGFVCQIIEPVTFARCAFIFALCNIALGGYLDTRRNIKF